MKTTAPERKVSHLSVRLEIKAGTANEDARTFQGLASTWDEDLGGDVIHQGAFARTLSHWRTSGRVMPLIDLHRYDSVRRVVGKMMAAEETNAGLLCTFAMMEAGDPDADAAWRRVKGGYVTGLSIGYRAVKYEYVQPPGGGYDIRHLNEVELREVSLVIWGMNPGAQIDTGSAKSLADALRAGGLTDEEKAEIRALLDAPAPAPAPEPPAVDAPKGLAPEDPRRLALEAAVRALTIRSLAA
ncbi:MAG: phage prohead protease, family [Gemmatimonadetes bacterium]|nr:phage prohead protease, family [Gemmatimonadota bacterium]